MPERELQAALDQLGEAGLLFCRGTAPHASYLFKHALVQDAAYSTLLRGRRQELHARVAAALEAAFRRSRRAPAGTARPSPDGCRRHRTRGRSMAEGGAACRSAIGLPRSDCPFRARSRPAAFAAGEPDPERPRNRAATGVGALSIYRQRRRRSEAGLYAGARACREQRRAAATVRGALWGVAVNSR